jgi:hypothetical protein
MNWGKIDAALASKMTDDQSWLLPGLQSYAVFVTLEDGTVQTGQFSALGISDLSGQTWIKSIRLSGSSKLV